MRRPVGQISALSLVPNYLQPSLVPGRHLAHAYILSLDRTISKAKILFDCDVSAESFLDPIFAQQHQIPVFLLETPRELQDFDGQPTKSDFITHFVRALLNIIVNEALCRIFSEGKFGEENHYCGTDCYQSYSPQTSPSNEVLPTSFIRNFYCQSNCHPVNSLVKPSVDSSTSFIVSRIATL